jgi:hypothetical protein
VIVVGVPVPPGLIVVVAVIVFWHTRSVPVSVQATGC